MITEDGMAILLSWLGRTDLDQMKVDKPASIATIALKGPVLDEVVILASTWDDYQEWLKKKLSLANYKCQRCLRMPLFLIEG